MSTTNEQVREGMSLVGLSVLVVEDDYLLAKEVASTLREHGAVVLGPVPDVARGRALLTESRPDCALLDINLKGHSCTSWPRSSSAWACRQYSLPAMTRRFCHSSSPEGLAFRSPSTCATWCSVFVGKRRRADAPFSYRVSSNE